MTPEAQRVAIAEACGWRIKQIKVSGMKDVLLIPPNWPKDAMAYTGDLPDYIGDLNAMHEAEKTLGDASFDYDKHLLDIIKSGCRVSSFDSYPGDFIWYATAAQRAEAFLKTKGLWV